MYERLNITVSYRDAFSDRYAASVNLNRLDVFESDSWEPIDFCDARVAVFGGEAARNIPQKMQKRKVDAEKLAHELTKYIMEAMAAEDMKNGYKINDNQS